MKKKILSLGTAFLIAVGVGLHPMVVSADVNNSGLQFDSGSAKTEGLISMCSLSISNSNGNVSITATTRSNSIMNYIGFKNISVQRRPNINSSWTEEVPVSNQLNHNSTIKTLSGFTVPVSGGYYYRVVLDHYADNGSGTTQSESNTSNVIWIS